MKDSLQRKREVWFTSHKAELLSEKVGDVNGFWQSGFMPCISIYMEWIQLFCEREKNFTFYFSRKTFVNFNEISRLQTFFSARFFLPQLEVQPEPYLRVHLSSLPKCSTQNVLNESRGRMSTAINYARNAAEKSFGRKGLLCMHSCGAAPVQAAVE